MSGAPRFPPLRKGGVRGVGSTANHARKPERARSPPLRKGGQGGSGQRQIIPGNQNRRPLPPLPRGGSGGRINGKSFPKTRLGVSDNKAQGGAGGGRVNSDRQGCRAVPVPLLSFPRSCVGTRGPTLGVASLAETATTKGTK